MGIPREFLKIFLKVSLLVAGYALFASMTEGIISREVHILLIVGWFIMAIIYSICWAVYRRWIRPQVFVSDERGMASATVFIIMGGLSYYVIPGEVWNTLSATIITGVIFMMPFLIVPLFFKLPFSKLKFW